MARTENKTSEEVNALSSVIREYITRHCITLASYMPDRSSTSFGPVQETGRHKQATKTTLSLKE